MFHGHGSWDKVLDIKFTGKIALLKEMTIINYSDSPILEVLVPVAEVIFILNDNPLPPRGRWWLTVTPIT